MLELAAQIILALSTLAFAAVLLLMALAPLFTQQENHNPEPYAESQIIHTTDSPRSEGKAPHRR